MTVTPLQRTTLRVAWEMGWYEVPKRCRLADIAKVLGTTRAAVHPVLTKAEKVAVEEFLAPEAPAEPQSPRKRHKVGEKTMLDARLVVSRLPVGQWELSLALWQAYEALPNVGQHRKVSRRQFTHALDALVGDMVEKRVGSFGKYGRSGVYRRVNERRQPEGSSLARA